MAQIDASGLTFSFSAFLPSSVSFNPGTATPFSYSWQSDDLFRITALSYSADITAGLAGTVDAVNILGSTFEPGLSINGIDVQLTSLIDAGNDTLNHEKFWDTLLAGETTLYLPDQGSQLDIMGDFVRVATGQTRTGGADTFIGGYPFSPSGNLSGDAIRVDAGGTLHGGADRFVDTLLSGLLVGDVGSPSGFADSVGTVYGGDDVFTLQDRQFSPSSYIGQIVGDVRQTADGSAAHGGNDTVTLTNLGGFSDVIGDVQYSNGILFGGDDVILIATTLLGRNFTSGNYVTGDAQTASLNGATVLTATGGDDAITQIGRASCRERV